MHAKHLASEHYFLYMWLTKTQTQDLLNFYISNEDTKMCTDSNDSMFDPFTTLYIWF